MMQLVRFIFLAFGFLLANHSYGSDLLLQWQVVGKYDDERLAPATLLVTVTQLPKYLSIDIDGPSDYLMGVSTFTGERNGKIFKGKNVSIESTFAINQTVTDINKNISGEYNVSINRITGLLSVSHYFRASSGNLHITDFSGNCTKTSSTQKFWDLN